MKIWAILTLVGSWSWHLEPVRQYQPRPYRHSKYQLSDFVTPASFCRNPEFDLKKYLHIQNKIFRSTLASYQPSFQQGERYFPVRQELFPFIEGLPREMYLPTSKHWKRYTYGTGHTFNIIGGKEGHSCSRFHNTFNAEAKTADIQDDSPEWDESGCALYSQASHKLDTLRVCLHERLNVDNDLLMSLAKVANSDVEWNVQSLRNSSLRTMLVGENVFREKGLGLSAVSKTIECVHENAMTRNDLKCVPVLMGASGYVKEGLREHKRRYEDKYESFAAYECQVLPVCARLATERIYQFEAATYNKYILGGFHYQNKLKYGRGWKLTGTDSVLRHERCNLRADLMGSVICWNYTKCLRLMMDQVCAEHPECCPTREMHSICKADIRSPGCKVCPLNGRQMSYKPW